jgi:hypothetical protein
MARPRSPSYRRPAVVRTTVVKFLTQQRVECRNGAIATGDLNTPSQTPPIRPDSTQLFPQAGQVSRGFEIGQPHFIRPSIAADRDQIGAPLLAWTDQ